MAFSVIDHFLTEKLKMKNTVVTAALLSALCVTATQAIADGYTPGQAAFQWAGTVPAQTDTDGTYFIVPVDPGQDFNNGQLVFSNTAAGGVKLTNSSTIGFKVVKNSGDKLKPYDPSKDIDPLSYNATLVSRQFSDGNFLVEDDAGAFQIMADGQELKKGVPLSKGKDHNTTNLRVKQSDDVIFEAEQGEHVVVQAVVAIAPTEA